MADGLNAECVMKMLTELVTSGLLSQKVNNEWGMPMLWRHRDWSNSQDTIYNVWM